MVYYVQYPVFFSQWPSWCFWKAYRQMEAMLFMHPVCNANTLLRYAIYLPRKCPFAIFSWIIDIQLIKKSKECYSNKKSQPRKYHQPTSATCTHFFQQRSSWFGSNTSRLWAGELFQTFRKKASISRVPLVSCCFFSLCTISIAIGKHTGLSSRRNSGLFQTTTLTNAQIRSLEKYPVFQRYSVLAGFDFFSFSKWGTSSYSISSITQLFSVVGSKHRDQLDAACFPIPSLLIKKKSPLSHSGKTS